MIAPRAERRALRAARPLLVVGMAPSRNEADLSDPASSHPAGRTLSRLAGYAGLGEAELLARADFVNLLPAWPGEVGGGDPKWDAQPDRRDWAVGQRASLLLADLWERPRHLVVGLGGYVRDALTDWWGLAPAGWLEQVDGPGGCRLAWSPHPAGTSMWWNDPANLEAGRGFWGAVVGPALPRAPRRVPLSVRSRWLVGLCERFGPLGWPDACVDWPWVDPPGRPQALLRGRVSPAAHAALELAVGPRPSRAHQALHSCDRGEDCVNGGRHLRWGTELENRIDQSLRGRGSIGRVGLEQAHAVRERLEALSEETGVPMDAIARIAGGRSWDPSSWADGEETS